MKKDCGKAEGAGENTAERTVERTVRRAVERLRGCGKEGDGRMLLALSGGADSVALLTALSALGVPFDAAHCNFHLRGEESMRDQRHVERLCADAGVRLHLADFDVDGYRARRGGSMEMACRELRYDWFRDLMRRHGYLRLLTAHHADDNVETMLMRMARGCGLEGAKGMVADTGEILRPLLTLHRADIEEYLRARGVEWITDSSNLCAEPDRNFIRLEVLPLLERRWPGVARRLARTQENLRGEWMLSRAGYAGIASETGTVLPRPLPGEEEEETLVRVHRFLDGKGFDRRRELEMARCLRRSSSGTRMWQSPQGKVALVRADGLTVVGAMPAMRLEWTPVELTPQERRRMLGNADRDVAWLPRPAGEYSVGPPRPGDRLAIAPGRRKKLSDALKEAGVPLPWRAAWPVVRRGDEVIWVPGVRRAAAEPVADTAACCHRVRLIVPR